MIKVYFYNSLSEEQVPATAPQSMEKREVMRNASMLLKEKDSFIGFIDADGTTLQFYSDGPDMITMDIPDNAKKGSYQKPFNQKDAMHFILGLDEPFAPLIEALRLKFIAW